MRWNVTGRRLVYESEWVNVWIDEVEAPGQRFEHHVLRMPKRTVSVVVVNDADHVLLLWRHRFITDTWGWEIPAGWVEPGEELNVAAGREVIEETGWRADTIEPLVTYNTLSGISSLQMHTFLGTNVERVGPIQDVIESSRVEWVPLSSLPELARKGEIADGPSLTGLTYFMATR